MAAGPSWEDQIVPTLRKRLEHEQAYLDRRLSSNNFSEYATQPSVPSSSNVFPPLPEVPHHSSTGGASRIPVSPRQRTKSSFEPNVHDHFTALSAPRQSHDESRPPAQYAAPSDRQQGLEVRPDAMRRGSSGASAASGSDRSDTETPTRIPSRPRSKSQLGARPKIAHQSSSGPHPPLPVSRIPRPSSSRRGSSNAYDDSNRGTGLPEVYGHRQRSTRTASPELGSRTVEGLVKNELPPFLYTPDDAMRIAEKGHDLWNEDEGAGVGYGSAEDRRGQNPLSRSVGGMDEREGKRKRNITMRPERTSYLDDGVERGQEMPLDQAMVSSGQRQQASNIGLGVPTSSTLRNQATSRSASSRTPNSGKSATPRSASLNLLASTGSGMPSSSPSSSRLGVAAHFVPPENTYTPPKNANWDEVVLPTVAKKLGMADGDRRLEGDEGDLAVEWDKDGTPIKWVKRELLNTSQTSNLGGPVGSATATSPSSFSPTFEPSPNNPMRYSYNSVRRAKSGENIELSPMPTPIRTSRGQAAPLCSDSSTSLAAPPELDSARASQSNDAGPGDRQQMSRKPSLLRRVTNGGSERNRRSNGALQPGQEGNISQGTFGPSTPIRTPSSRDVSTKRPGYARGPSSQSQWYGHESEGVPANTLRGETRRAGSGSGQGHGQRSDPGPGQSRSLPQGSFGRAARGDQESQSPQTTVVTSAIRNSVPKPTGSVQARPKKEETVEKGCGCVVM